jgi:hypothetical protein
MEKDFARFEGTKYTVEADIEMCTMVSYIYKLGYSNGNKIISLGL